MKHLPSFSSARCECDLRDPRAGKGEISAVEMYRTMCVSKGKKRRLGRANGRHHDYVVERDDDVNCRL